MAYSGQEAGFVVAPHEFTEVDRRRTTELCALFAAGVENNVIFHDDVNIGALARIAILADETGSSPSHQAQVIFDQIDQLAIDAARDYPELRELSIWTDVREQSVFRRIAIVPEPGKAGEDNPSVDRRDQELAKQLLKESRRAASHTAALEEAREKFVTASAELSRAGSRRATAEVLLRERIRAVINDEDAPMVAKQLAVSCLNGLLARSGLPPVSIDSYKDSLAID